MAENLKTKLVITADTKGLTASVVTGNKVLQTLSTQSESTATNVKKIDKATKGASSTLEKFAKVAGGLYIAKQMLDTSISFVKSADAVKLLESRVKLATEQTGGFSFVMGELNRLTRENRQELNSTVSLYQNFARSAPELGASNQQILKMLDNVQKLGLISGTTAVAQSNALTQLSQGFAGGILRAEEFNSIVENTPALAMSIADGMGITVGQLRLAVIEGTVLSQDVFQAILSQTEEINRKAGEMPITFQQTTTVLGTAWDNFASKLNKSIQLAETFGSKILGIAGYLDDLSFDTNFDASVDTASVDQLNDQLARLNDEMRNLKQQSEATDSITGSLDGFYSDSMSESDLRKLDTLKMKIGGIESALKDRENKEEADTHENEVRNGVVVAKTTQPSKNTNAKKATKVTDYSDQNQALLAAQKARLLLMQAQTISEEALIKARYSAQSIILEEKLTKQKASKSQLTQAELLIEQQKQIALAELEEKRKEKAAELLGEQYSRLEEQKTLAEGELSLIDYKYEMELEKFNEQSEALKLTEEERAEGRLNIKLYYAELEANKLNEIYGISTAKYKFIHQGMANWDKANWKHKIAYTANYLQQLTAINAASSKDMFELNKYASAATATVNAYQAITNAMATIPYPANIAAATSMGVLAFAQVSKIMSSKFGGGASSSGGGSISAGSASSYPTSTPITVQNSAEQRDEDESNLKNITIKVQGKIFDRDTLKELSESIAENARDGAVTNIIYEN